MTHTYAHKHTTVASQQLTDSSIQEVVKFRHFPSSSVLYTVTRLHPKKLINIGEMNVLGVLTFFFLIIEITFSNVKVFLTNIIVAFVLNISMVA